jgi:transcription elongation factor Elf1
MNRACKFCCPQCHEEFGLEQLILDEKQKLFFTATCQDCAETFHFELEKLLAVMYAPKAKSSGNNKLS